MLIKLKETLKMIENDAIFLIFHYNKKGTFHSSFETKEYIIKLMEFENPILEGEYIFFKQLNKKIHKDYFNQNVLFETKNTQGYTEYKYRKYYNIFIKLDKENKRISYKLGEKEKTLELMEEGLDGYVCKPYKQKYLRCVNFEYLERYINDKDYTNNIVFVGRKILKIRYNI